MQIGSHSRGASLFTSLKKAIRNLRARVTYALGRGLPVPKDVWERQFSSGDWKKLEDEIEREHYAAIANLHEQYSPFGAVLDVGCGPGVTRTHLRLRERESYLGVDLSDEAVRQALIIHPLDQFVQGNAELGPPSGEFGTIIFNEVCYYFSNPCDVVQSYANSLLPGGVIIVSMCRYPGHDSIWAGLSSRFSLLSAVQCGRDDGQVWTVKAFRCRKG